MARKRISSSVIIATILLLALVLALYLSRISIYYTNVDLWYYANIEMLKDELPYNAIQVGELNHPRISSVSRTSDYLLLSFQGVIVESTEILFIVSDKNKIRALAADAIGEWAGNVIHDATRKEGICVLEGLGINGNGFISCKLLDETCAYIYVYIPT